MSEPRKSNGQVFSSEKRGQTFFLHAWEVSMVGGKRPESRDFISPTHALHDPDVDLPVDMSLVESIRMRGQRQAIEVRKEKTPEDLELRTPVNMREDEVAVVAFGRQRLKAITYINETDGLWGTPGEVLVECKPTAKGTTLQDAAEDSMIENGQRRDVRAIAVVEKARAYLNQFGDDEETLARCAIANRLSVKRLKALLDFVEKAPAKTLKALKTGQLGVNAALELAKLSPERQAEVLSKNTKVTATEAAAAVREDSGKTARPGVRELKKTYAGLDPEAPVSKFITEGDLRAVLAWILGEGPQPPIGSTEQ